MAVPAAHVPTTHFLSRSPKPDAMFHSRRRFLCATAASSSLVAGCVDGTAPPSTQEPTDTPVEDQTLPPADATYAYTHVRASGNRVLAGSGDVVGADPVDVSIDGTPAWLLAFGGASATDWTVVTADGAARTYRLGDGEPELRADHGSVSGPPLGYSTDEAVGVAAVPADCAEHTHPVVAADEHLYVAADGDLVISGADETTRLDVRAPPDARIVAVGEDTYALYGARTDRYRHGALGDTVEGGSLVVVDAASRTVETTVTLDPPAVFEGVSPLAADLDGDGDAELVTTVATPRDGASLRAYAPDGTPLATGPSAGSGWRHQLCIAPFAADGRRELAAVRRPHVDRVVEYYRLADGDLTVSTERRGYASHTYGSRNLDGALGADVDGDGQPELVVPTADRRTLAAVSRVEDGTETAWSAPIGGSLTTNLTGVALGDGRVAIGAGTADGLRIWAE